MKKRRVFAAAVLILLFLVGCGNRVIWVQNKDDGRLRLDKKHTVDFYLGNLTEGADPITDQCLAILSDQTPESVQDGDDWYPGGTIAIYRFNGATIRILRYGEGEQILLEIELGENHILSSGICIGSTEAELLESYGDGQGFSPYPFDIYGDDVRAYVFWRVPWFERYYILFKVDAASGKITSISYCFDS